MGEPIDNIEWVDASSLSANEWNPNVVFNQELRLLEFSLLQTGWIQPILVSRAGTVIDGFHRWRLSLDGKVAKKYGGKVPVARLDIGEDEAMALTVRINRAKGSHVAVRMSDLVKKLTLEHGWSRERVAQEIGATLDEVDLLVQDSIFKAKKLADYKYGKAWVPAEDGKENRPQKNR